MLSSEREVNEKLAVVKCSSLVKYLRKSYGIKEGTSNDDYLIKHNLHNL